MLYFKKHWWTELQHDVTTCVEEVVSKTSSHCYFTCSVMFQFKEWYLLLSPDLGPQESVTLKKTKRGIHILLCKLSDSEDNTTDSHPGVSEDPDWLWSRHFDAYMNVSEQVPDSQSVIKWQGVSSSAPQWFNIQMTYHGTFSG